MNGGRKVHAAARPTGRTGAERLEARELLRAIRALVRRFALSERADVECCGLTVAQAATLEVLRAEGRMRPGLLSRRLGISPSTFARNLARLEEAGLVERLADPRDARAFDVGLTRSGQRAAGRLERQDEAFALQVISRVPGDRRGAALAALRDLLLAVREATETCCPGAFDHLMSDFPPGSTPAVRCADGPGSCDEG